MPWQYLTDFVVCQDFLGHNFEMLYTVTCVTHERIDSYTANRLFCRMKGGVSGKSIAYSGSRLLVIGRKQPRHSRLPETEITKTESAFSLSYHTKPEGESTGCYK
jgi:hypothetical protein